MERKFAPQSVTSTKTHHPAAFYTALLNAWPMGFYHHSARENLSGVSQSR